MQHMPRSSIQPSEETRLPWVAAQRRQGEYPDDTANSGKWLVFVRSSEVDEVWQRIKTATEEGRLGNRAKAATAAPNRLARNPNRKVICVYTYDWTDEQDVRRVRQELGKLGITWKIAYKADQDTLQGKYLQTGHKNISKYYE